jgi:hypothetical protein
VAAILMCSISAYSNPTVNEKVLNAFQKTFQYAKEISWMQESNCWEVTFVAVDDIRMRVMYDEDGNILNTIRYYYADKLPLLITQHIRSRFPGKKIFGVIEETTKVGMNYHIILEDAKAWTTIATNETGIITVEKKTKKG